FAVAELPRNGDANFPHFCISVKTTDLITRARESAFRPRTPGFEPDPLGGARGLGGCLSPVVPVRAARRKFLQQGRGRLAEIWQESWRAARAFCSRISASDLGLRPAALGGRFVAVASR